MNLQLQGQKMLPAVKADLAMAIFNLALSLVCLDSARVTKSVAFVVSYKMDFIRSCRPRVMPGFSKSSHILV